ncbi:MAG TPA: aminoglycoside phosphotransferase family protein [Dehalococcoidia bacterium]|jgi:hygromycin-B 7''-O-kinase|nr:aminoglycoside phosphotransferase family protein [Dehalococcoidia bacterium]
MTEPAGATAWQDDPVLPEPTVLALVRRHVPDAERLTAVDESGRKGRAYIVNERIVLKTHRPVRLRARVIEEFETDPEKEAFFLQLLASDERIKAPRLLGHGQGFGVQYVCMTRVPGVALRQSELDAERRRRALAGLGRTLRRIHALPLEPVLASGLFPSKGPPAQLRARLEALFARLVAAHHELPPEWRLATDVEQAARAALAALPDDPARAVLHSNPAAEHVFADPADGSFLGLIDFGDGYVGHPALDLRPWRDPADRAAVLEGYESEGPVDAAFLATMRVGQIVGALAAALRMRETRARLGEALRTLLDEL